MVKIWIMSLILGLFLSYQAIPVMAEQGFNGSESKEMEVVQMKAHFYRFDRATGERGEYVGFAELRGNELICSVSDSRLERILKGDLHTTGIVEENGRKATRFITHKVGTIEHFQDAIDNCADVGCVAEVVEK